jgi:hypothetical protein
MRGKGSTKRPGRPQIAQHSHRSARCSGPQDSVAGRRRATGIATRFSTAEWCRRTDREGTLIRHARRRVTLPVGTLPVAMIEPAFWTLLVATVGSAALPAASFGATTRAAIALPAVAVRADPEHPLASLGRDKLAAGEALPLEPPAQPPAGFDNGNGSCQGGNSLDGSLHMKVAKPEPRCLERRGSPPPSKVTIPFFAGIF